MNYKPDKPDLQNETEEAAWNLCMAAQEYLIKDIKKICYYYLSCTCTVSNITRRLVDRRTHEFKYILDRHLDFLKLHVTEISQHLKAGPQELIKDFCSDVKNLELDQYDDIRRLLRTLSVPRRKKAITSEDTWKGRLR